MTQPPHSQTPLTHAVALAVATLLVASLAACGGGSATTDTTGTQPTTPAPTPTPATPLTFAGGVPVTLENVDDQSLTLATSESTTDQTPVEFSSSSAAIFPRLKRTEDGKYTLHLQAVGSHQGQVTVNIQIGKEKWSVAVNVDTILRISDTSTVLANIGSTPRTFTCAEFLALFPEHANVASIELTSENIVDSNGKVLATITQDKEKGTITVTPMRSGGGIIPLRVNGLPSVVESPQSAPPPPDMTKKDVTVPVSGITSPPKSLELLSPTMSQVLSSDFHATVATFSCLDMEGKNCVPKISGPNAGLFEIYGNTVVIKKDDGNTGYLPSGTYQISLEIGNFVTPTIVVISRDPVTAPAPTTPTTPSCDPNNDPLCA